MMVDTPDVALLTDIRMSQALDRRKTRDGSEIDFLQFMNRSAVSLEFDERPVP